MGSQHEKQDDSDKYITNGYEPGKALPPEDTGGRHTKEDEKNEDEEK